jgi:RNA polymerase sigma-70 factor (ECF subfamily)
MALESCASHTDEEIVHLVREGQTGLFELLMRRHNQRLYRTVRSVSLNDSEAEDVLQDAWVRAFHHLDQFEGRSAFATWVTKIAFYEALARARTARRFTSVEEQEKPMTASSLNPEQDAMRGELGRLLQSSIDSLPEEYRTVFMLREVEQLSTAETAECMGLSEEAVKTRLHRSRALLRGDLQSRIGPAVAATYAFMGTRCDRTVTVVMARITG